MNAKVKREAMTCIGLLHQQIGPGLKGLAMSLAKQSGVKELLQKSFEENPFDSSSHFTSWSRTSVTAKQNPLNVKGRDSSPSFKLDVPKTDLFLVLPPDILTKLVRR